MMMNIIHQIWITKDNSPPSIYIQNKINKLKQLYYDFDYKLYNNEECRDIIKSTWGSNSLNLYDSIKPFAFKSDIARYTILYNKGGYYYDVSLAPSTNLKFNTSGVLYEGIIDLFVTNNLPLIENNFMYFNSPKHQFLEKAIETCFKNIKAKRYGNHPLSITGPIMLGTLNTFDITLGKVKKISKNDYASFFKDTLHYYHKPHKYRSNLSLLGAKGTNNYEKMWFDKEVYI